MKLLIVFILLNIINVILQTIKSIYTIKGGRISASLINAITFGVYTILIVYINASLNLWIKVAVTAIANLIGVYVVKTLEEKARKDKLWKIEASVEPEKTENIMLALETLDIGFSVIQANLYDIFNIYSKNQKESAMIREILSRYDAKYFVTETLSL